MDIDIDPGRPIAMVDDNPADLVFAKTCFDLSRLENLWLEFDGGQSLIAYLDRAKGGEAALPALVLLDVSMPRMNGHQVLQRVRSDPFYSEVPIFCMLTGSGAARDREQATRLGASGFMVKPNSIEGYVAFFDSLASDRSAHH